MVMVVVFLVMVIMLMVMMLVVVFMAKVITYADDGVHRGNEDDGNGDCDSKCCFIWV